MAKQKQQEPGKIAVELTNVLSAMFSYLVNSNKPCINPQDVYCNSCRKVGAALGPMEVYEGTDCGGAVFRTKKYPYHCSSCGSIKFIEISLKDMDALRKTFGREVYNRLIEGIDLGLESMGHPQLYNPELPKIANKWERLSRDKKKAQIRQLFRLQDEIADSKAKIGELEARL